MTLTPLMPMATAVWLVENTTLTFKQIADFCNLHEVEVQGIADGEVAKGIKAYNPITSGQLTKEEIELSSKDQDRALKITNTDVEITSDEKKIKKYVPLSKRQDKPDSVLWLIKSYPQLKDSQIAKLVGITKNSLESQRQEEHFCKQVSQRRKMRKEFDRPLGKVRYVHVEREKVTQFVIYTSRKTIFFTMEPELTIQRKMKIVSQIKRIAANL